MAASKLGYLILLIGYILLGIGVYFFSFSKGAYSCNPTGDFTCECVPNKEGVYGRYRRVPSESGITDPDGSILYEDQFVTDECPKQDCVMSDWTRDGSFDKTSNTQKWKRTPITIPQFGGKACPEIQTATTSNPNLQPSEAFRFRRRHRFIKLGIESDPNYGGGIAGIVFGCIFVIVGNALIFTAQK